MQYTWKPCESDVEDLKELEGHIVLNVPKYKERMELIKSLKLKVTDGTIEMGDEQFDSFDKILEIVKKRITKIELKYGDMKFKTLEDLEHYEVFTHITSELWGLIGNGIKLGKKQKPQ